jgi:hypothetical protein
MADSYAETPNGILMVADGFDNVLRWDGMTPQMELAGIIAPDQAPVLSSGGGSGPIVGTYLAYVRYVDRNDQVSNLSPVSASFSPVGATGGVIGSTNATPIVITTSAPHGLVSGAFVKVDGVGGNTSANNTWVITVIDASNFSLNDSTGTAGYTGGGAWTSGVAAITYSNVQSPQDAKIARRQLLRNTDGEANTFYVDIDTFDLTSTTFSSTKNDTTLAAGIAVPILDTTGLPLANLHQPPPNWKAVLAHHLDRMFLAVQYDYKQGAVKTFFGGLSVQGVGTEFTAAMVGRFLYVVGATKSYEITLVDTGNQILWLTTPYTDTPDNFAAYSIQPPPAERRLVYFSEAGLPESWPPTNAIELQEDGDEITGLMAKGSFVFILERRHIYRLTFQSDPLTDGGIFLSGNRGCVNHRCWVDVEGTSYMLDEEGIHAFDGGQQIQAAGSPVQQLFRPGELVQYQINWRASPYFHAVHYAKQQTIRWFVALSGDELPRHAIAYNYRQQRWWLEEFRIPIGASTPGFVRNIPVVLLGGPFRQVFLFWQNYLDGPDPTAGTVRGTATSAGLLSLTDTLAAFASSGVIGSPLAIVDGTGKGQMRQIVSVVGQTLGIDLPWSVMPDTTSVYQVGAIQYQYRCTWFPFAINEEWNERRLQMVFEPGKNAGTMDLRVMDDFSDTPTTWVTSIPSGQGDGISNNAEVDKYSLIVDLTTKRGVVQKRFGWNKEMYIGGVRYGQCELGGFTNQDAVIVYQITFDGVTKAGG